jgi:SAM-dependent methyltransferase
VQPAAARWATALARWAIPQELIDAVPESPWPLPPAMFAYRPPPAGRGDTPSVRRAREALPARGVVLDVGAGGGAASLPLARDCALVLAVDESEAMLRAFAGAADAAGVPHEEFQGRWPEVAREVPVADVVVCGHVLYNVSPLVPFAEALTAHCRRRVVVEVTLLHPASDLNRLWRHFHGIDFPARPTLDDGVAVLREMGLAVEVERWEAPPRADGDLRVLAAFARRRLCLPPEREAEVEALLDPADPLPMTRQVATIWWGPREPS